MSNQLNTIKETLEHASKIAQAQQVDAFEIQASCDQGHVIDVRNLTPEKLEFNMTQHLSVTIYHQGNSGHASTSDLSISGLQSTIDHAKTIAKFTEKDPFSGIVDKKLLCQPQRLDYLYRPWKDFSIEKAIDIAKKCENYGLSNNEIFQSEGASVDSFNLIYGLTNSHGFFDVFEQTRHSISAGFVSKDMHGMQQDYAHFTAHDFDLLPDIAEIAALAITRTLSKRNPQRIKSQKLPIILEPRVAKSLWHHMLSALRGTKQYHKNTFLLDTLGKQITDNNISIIEDPDIVDGIGSQSYDSEGVNKGKNPIIIDGCLSRYLLNSYSGRQLNMETTGNAGGISNIIVHTKKPATKDDLIKQMNQGIIVHETMGQGANLVTGDYSQGASGYYVEKGQIKYPIDNFSIVSNLAEMLLNIQGISHDDINKNGHIHTGSVLIENCFISSQ